ncbi:EIF2D [Symbiodinium sp. CCMP2456]|nr:EIF2D [Symbiodinium sp. CCMP2456]
MTCCAPLYATYCFAFLWTARDTRGSESFKRPGQRKDKDKKRPGPGGFAALFCFSGQLTELFPSLDEKMLDEILPEGQAKATRLKKVLFPASIWHGQWAKVVKLDNRCLLYSCGDAAPAFFDAEGRGSTRRCTRSGNSRAPSLNLSLFVVFDFDGRSKFVLNGADLMLPGVLVPANGVAGFGTVTKGQPRCIKIDGNPYPIAVGRMVVNQTQMEKRGPQTVERKRHGGDARVQRRLVGAVRQGETQCRFLRRGGGSSVCRQQLEAWRGERRGQWHGGACVGGSGRSVLSDGSTRRRQSCRTPRNGRNERQDDLLDFTFLQAFKQGLADDKALPIEASELYEKHMKPARPEGTTLDVKKSSHKQIGKFLNAMRKSKAIDVTEKKGVIHVSKVDRKHKVFVSLEEKFAEQVAATPVAAVAAAVTPAGLPPPKVTAMWKPSHYLEPIWKAMGKKKDELYTWDEARAIVFSYIEQEGLGKPDGPIKMSDGLLTALWKTAGGQKKDQEWPTEVDAEQVEEKLEDRLQQLGEQEDRSLPRHAAIDVAGVGVTTRKGAPVNIAISLREPYRALGDELKKKLNCTVYIEDMPGKNAVKEKMLQLQGHVDQEFAQFLEQRYGITKKFLEVK